MYNTFWTQNTINYYILRCRYYYIGSFLTNATLLYIIRSTQPAIDQNIIRLGYCFKRVRAILTCWYSICDGIIHILISYNKPTIRNSTPRRYLFIFLMKINVYSIAYAFVQYYYSGTDTSRSRSSEWPTIAAVVVSKITCLHYCTYIVDFSLFGTSILCVFYVYMV